MSTHAVSSDTDPARVQLLRESSEDSLGQFLGDVTVHVVASVVRSLSGIDVEAGARAKVVRIILTLDVETTWKVILASYHHKSPVHAFIVAEIVKSV